MLEISRSHRTCGENAGVIPAHGWGIMLKAEKSKTHSHTKRKALTPNLLLSNKKAGLIQPQPRFPFRP